ncbi:uncharacterized protein [Apostichopus japonicus]|uniref:uncharacterized protein n=1 Tax=Stichopus japonicus TaxID=307972 RepID=UPI003AB4E210
MMAVVVKFLCLYLLVCLSLTRLEVSAKRDYKVDRCEDESLKFNSSIGSTQSFVEVSFVPPVFPHDTHSKKITSGVYLIRPIGYLTPFEVYCSNWIDGSGWTVIQRRSDGFVNFKRNWSEHKEGFGFLSTEFWIGNEKLSHLTNQAVYELRVDMTLSNGSSFYSAYKGFRIADEWSQYKIVNMIALDSNVGTLISACPSNMIYATCSCKATCEDPNGQTGYSSDCLGSEGCTCPAGFLIQGSDCILPSECGCFETEINSVIPNRETYFNNDCTQKCSCSNNRLICEDNRCSTNAVCDVRDGLRKCYCNEGYGGDGYICESLSDCQDVYDAGHRQDGVYTFYQLDGQIHHLVYIVKWKMVEDGQFFNVAVAAVPVSIKTGMRTKKDLGT